MKERKYTYEKVLQGYFSSCYGFEDLVSVETGSTYTALDAQEGKEFRENIKAYRENDPRPYRVIKRRTLKGVTA